MEDDVYEDDKNLPQKDDNISEDGENDDDNDLPDIEDNEQEAPAWFGGGPRRLS